MTKVLNTHTKQVREVKDGDMISLQDVKLTSKQLQYVMLNPPGYELREPLPDEAHLVMSHIDKGLMVPDYIKSSVMGGLRWCPIANYKPDPNQQLELDEAKKAVTGKSFDVYMIDELAAVRQENAMLKDQLDHITTLIDGLVAEFK